MIIIPKVGLRYRLQNTTSEFSYECKITHIDDEEYGNNCVVHMTKIDTGSEYPFVTIPKYRLQEIISNQMRDVEVVVHNTAQLPEELFEL